jgi:hypothetical protein
MIQVEALAPEVPMVVVATFQAAVLAGVAAATVVLLEAPAVVRRVAITVVVVVRRDPMEAIEGVAVSAVPKVLDAAVMIGVAQAEVDLAVAMPVAGEIILAARLPMTHLRKIVRCRSQRLLAHPNRQLR